MLGFVSSCYQLGSIIGVPIAPWVNQRWGRRWSVFGGSVLMVIGSLIQGFSKDRRSNLPNSDLIKANGNSWDVHLRSNVARIWDCVCHHFRLITDWRAGTPEGSRYIDISVQFLLFHWVDCRSCNYSKDCRYRQQLELASSVTFANVSLSAADLHSLVSFIACI